MTKTWTIPPQGLRFTAADGTVVTAQRRPAGFLVQVRYPNHEISGRFCSFESQAADTYDRAVAALTIN